MKISNEFGPVSQAANVNKCGQWTILNFEHSAQLYLKKSKQTGVDILYHLPYYTHVARTMSLKAIIAFLSSLKNFIFFFPTCWCFLLLKRYLLFIKIKRPSLSSHKQTKATILSKAGQKESHAGLRTRFLVSFARLSSSEQ